MDPAPSCHWRVQNKKSYCIGGGWRLERAFCIAGLRTPRLVPCFLWLAPRANDLVLRGKGVNFYCCVHWLEWKRQKNLPFLKVGTLQRHGCVTVFSYNCPIIASKYILYMNDSDGKFLYSIEWRGCRNHRFVWDQSGKNMFFSLTLLKEMSQNCFLGHTPFFVFRNSLHPFNTCKRFPLFYKWPGFGPIPSLSRDLRAAVCL